MGILALKGMAKTVWTADQKQNHPQPKCWYQPASFPEEASLGLRWTLGHPVTAAIPPGDERYFRLAMDVAQNYKPLEPHEEQALLSGGHGVGADFPLRQRRLKSEGGLAEKGHGSGCAPFVSLPATGRPWRRIS